jgi:hypothetical protein
LYAEKSVRIIQGISPEPKKYQWENALHKDKDTIPAAGYFLLLPEK